MKKTNIIFFLFFFLLRNNVSYCQPLHQLDSIITKELKQAGDSILKGSNDSVRINYHDKFYSIIDSLLKDSLSFTLSFDSVKTLAVLQSQDKKLRIYNWILPLQHGGEFHYFGFVQINDKKTKRVQTFILSEKKWTTDSAEIMKLNNQNWYGALYYKIVQQKYNGKVYYTLLGWHGNSFQTTRKIIDVVSFNNNKIQFGTSIFKVGGKTKTRIVFEYNAQATMSLKYEEGDNRIVFDHLSPSDPRAEAKNMYSLYGPDMSYDALKFDKGFWIMQKNIQPRNEREHQQKEVPVEKKFRITKFK